MPTLAITNFNIVCSVLGGFITCFGLVSYLFKEKFYLSEACKSSPLLSSSILTTISDFPPSRRNLLPSRHQPRPSSRLYRHRSQSQCHHPLLFPSRARRTTCSRRRPIAIPIPQNRMESPPSPSRSGHDSHVGSQQSSDIWPCARLALFTCNGRCSLCYSHGSCIEQQYCEGQVCG